MIAAGVDLVSWEDFLTEFNWAQGEHVTLVGPTGGGKTTLAMAILHRRSWACVVATKARDPMLDRLRREGFQKIEQWPPPPAVRRVLLWPKFRSKLDLPNQRRVLSDAFLQMFESGGWCVCVDELYYLSKYLRLDADLILIWLQGRSHNLSLLGATQRPAWVPLEMYSQSTHLFFWRTSDRRDLDRIGGIGAIDPATIRREVMRLTGYHFLYVNARTGDMLSSQVTRSR